MIQFQCPGCNRAIQVGDDMAGHPARCVCGRVVQVPAAPAAPPPLPSPWAALAITCPHCRHVFQLGVEAAGQTLPCPACQGPLIVPAAPAPPAPLESTSSSPGKGAKTPLNPVWVRVRWSLTLLKSGTAIAATGATVLIVLVLMVNWASAQSAEVNQTAVLLPLALAGFSTLIMSYFLLLIGECLACAVPRPSGLLKYSVLSLTLLIVAPMLGLSGLGVFAYDMGRPARPAGPPWLLITASGLVFLALAAWTLRHLSWLLFLRRLGAAFRSRHVPDAAISQIISSMTFAAGSFLFCCALPVGHALAVGSNFYRPGAGPLSLGRVQDLIRDVGVVMSLIAALWVGILVTLVILYFNLVSEAQDALERGEQPVFVEPRRSIRRTRPSADNPFK